MILDGQRLPYDSFPSSASLPFSQFLLPSEAFLFPFSPLPSLSILCLLNPSPPCSQIPCFLPYPISMCNNACYVNSLFHHSMSVWSPSCTPHCICSPLCKVHVPCNLPHFLPKAVSDIRLTGMLPAHNNFPFNLQQGRLTSPLLLFVRRKATRKGLVCP